MARTQPSVQPLCPAGDRFPAVSGPRLRTPGQAGPGTRLAHTGEDHGARAVLADLFPAPVQPATRRAGIARWAFPLVQVAAIAVGTLVMLVRIGGPRPSWDRIYAEDPGLYLPAALAHPWHLLQAYGGYLQLIPRAIAQIAAVLPIQHASVVFAVGGALVASGCAGATAPPRTRRRAGTRWN